MSDVSRSFISFTPVVDVSFLKPELLEFVNEDLLVPLQYCEWNTGNRNTRDAEALSMALLDKGLPVHTNVLLKMY
jgi:hypothetical protein